jgi:hypothetical protein
MRPLTPVRAIRQKCFECAGSLRAATRCEKEDCPLYPYRTGRNPARAGIGGGVRRGNGRFSQKRPTQVVVSSDKKTTPQGSTPEINLGHPRAKSGQAPLLQIWTGGDLE